MRHRLTVLALLLLAGVAKPQAAPDEARLLRFPAIHGDTVVFTYAGNLYTVASTGGIACVSSMSRTFSHCSECAPTDG